MGQVPRTIHRFCSSRFLHDSHAKTNPIYEMSSILIRIRPEYNIRAFFMKTVLCGYHMKIHTNRKLFDSVNRNQQRLALEHLLETEKTALGWLANITPCFHPDTPDLLKKAISRAASNHSPCGTREETVTILKTAYEDRAHACMTEWANQLPHGEYYLSFGGGSVITFDSTIQWIPRLPVFLLPLSDILFRLHLLRPFCQGDCALVSSCGKHAVISESLSGYLPDEPSDDETVYELSMWHDNAN